MITTFFSAFTGGSPVGGGGYAMHDTKAQEPPRPQNDHGPQHNAHHTRSHRATNDTNPVRTSKRVPHWARTDTSPGQKMPCHGRASVPSGPRRGPMSPVARHNRKARTHTRARVTCVPLDCERRDTQTQTHTARTRTRARVTCVPLDCERRTHGTQTHTRCTLD